MVCKNIFVTALRSVKQMLPELCKLDVVMQNQSSLHRTIIVSQFISVQTENTFLRIYCHFLSFSEKLPPSSGSSGPRPWESGAYTSIKFPQKLYSSESLLRTRIVVFLCLIMGGGFRKHHKNREPRHLATVGNGKQV